MSDHISNPEIAQSISDLIDKWWTRETQYLAWLTGTATGGPYSDGRYPLTGKDGVTRYILCPAAMADSVTGLTDSASTYATAAAASATAADASDTAAEAAQTAAEDARDDASVSAGLAATSESNAANFTAIGLTYKNAAGTSATNAASSETAAHTSETNAATSATSASGSATSAAASAASAGTSATSAAASAAAAAASVSGAIRFKGTWNASVGTFPSSPATGDLWQVSVQGTISSVIYRVGDQIFYTGSAWDKIDNSEFVVSVNTRTGAVVLTSADVGLSSVSNALQLIASNNLSDLTNTATARTNIGLGSVANALQLAAANNLSDLGSVATARTNLGALAALMPVDVYLQGKDSGGTTHNLVGVSTSANKVLVGSTARGLKLQSLTPIQDQNGDTIASIHSGSFTGTYTGIGAGQTATIEYEIVGNHCILYFPTKNGTSTNTTFTITGLPAICWPASQKVMLARITDASTTTVGLCIIDSSGGITLQTGVGSSGAFTASSLKGMRECAVAYNLT